MQCEAKRLSGDCIITLTEEHDLEGVDFDYAGVDKATFRDVVQVSADVIHDCLVNPNNPNEGPR